MEQLAVSDAVPRRTTVRASLMGGRPTPAALARTKPPPPSLSSSAQPDRRSHRPPLAGLRILLLEDTRLQRLAIARMLRNAGAEVVGVATLRDAKDHLKYGGFDAAVLDLHLVTSPARSPHGHGLRAVSAALREGVPVVVATVYTLRQFTDAARAHGLKRSDLKRVIYVGKPFDTPALVQAIGSATGRTGGTVH